MQKVRVRWRQMNGRGQSRRRIGEGGGTPCTSQQFCCGADKECSFLVWLGLVK